MSKKNEEPQRLGSFLKIYRTAEETVSFADQIGNLLPPPMDVVEERLQYLKEKLLGKVRIDQLQQSAETRLQEKGTVKNIPDTASRIIDYLLGKEVKKTAWWAGAKDHPIDVNVLFSTTNGRILTGDIKELLHEMAAANAKKINTRKR